MAFPGGKAHLGESELDCAIREIREEVGLDMNEFKLIGRLDDRFKR